MDGHGLLLSIWQPSSPSASPKHRRVRRKRHRSVQPLRRLKPRIQLPRSLCPWSCSTGLPWRSPSYDKVPQTQPRNRAIWIFQVRAVIHRGSWRVCRRAVAMLTLLLLSNDRHRGNECATDSNVFTTGYTAGDYLSTAYKAAKRKDLIRFSVLSNAARRFELAVPDALGTSIHDHPHTDRCAVETDYDRQFR